MTFIFFIILSYLGRNIYGNASKLRTNLNPNMSFNQGIICPSYKKAPILDLKNLVGSWMTVYTQPRAVNCFTLFIRATTDLEQEQGLMKYGNFSGMVDWSQCLLEVESPLGRHYLQGTGEEGLLHNIIIVETENGGYKLHEQSADQWVVYGQRGRELLLMRDCSGAAAAVFARAPYWPTTTELYAVLHRSGIAVNTHSRVLCEQFQRPKQQCSISSYFAIKYNEEKYDGKE